MKTWVQSLMGKNAFGSSLGNTAPDGGGPYYKEGPIYYLVCYKYGDSAINVTSWCKVDRCGGVCAGPKSNVETPLENALQCTMISLETKLLVAYVKESNRGFGKLFHYPFWIHLSNWMQKYDTLKRATHPSYLKQSKIFVWPCNTIDTRHTHKQYTLCSWW